MNPRPITVVVSCRTCGANTRTRAASHGDQRSIRTLPGVICWRPTVLCGAPVSPTRPWVAPTYAASGVSGVRVIIRWLIRRVAMSTCTRPPPRQVKPAHKLEKKENSIFNFKDLTRKMENRNSTFDRKSSLKVHLWNKIKKMNKSKQ